MSSLYVDEPGTRIGFHDNRIRLVIPDGQIKEIPVEMVDTISVMGNVQLSSECMHICMRKGIPVEFFSRGGKYYGRLQAAGNVNTQRQRLQCELYESEFALQIAKRITMGKMQNQKVVLRRYGRSKGIDISTHVKTIDRNREKIKNALSIEEIMGHEGYAAKVYFAGLSILVEPEFLFCGRSHQPSGDEFNAMLNLGYTLLMNIMIGSLDSKGLNPYFGFLHRDREKHAALASDMMEEWRPIIVDSLVMSLINGHEIHKSDFVKDDNGYCLSKEGLKAFIRKLENKLKLKVKYLPDVPYSVSFRQGIILQIESLIRAMEQRDTAIYKPIEIR